VKHKIPHNGAGWEDAYLVGIHRYSYRSGEPAKIIGVVMYTPGSSGDSDDYIERPCYHIIFPDGVEEYTPVSDLLNYAIISEDDVERNNIPPVTQ
jgi:hypothetical protein